MSCSIILVSTGAINTGQKSEMTLGWATFGTGLMYASFHWEGTADVAMDRLNSSANGLQKIGVPILCVRVFAGVLYRSSTHGNLFGTTAGEWGQRRLREGGGIILVLLCYYLTYLLTWSYCAALTHVTNCTCDELHITAYSLPTCNTSCCSSVWHASRSVRITSHLISSRCLYYTL